MAATAARLLWLGVGSAAAHLDGEVEWSEVGEQGGAIDLLPKLQGFTVRELFLAHQKAGTD